MKIKRVGILGGSGFVGQHLAAKLVENNYEVVIVTRKKELHNSLKILPNVTIKTADANDYKQLIPALINCDAVINLIGILNESSKIKGEGFRQSHVATVKNLVSACEKLGIKRILHMSALNADQARGASYYLRTKGEAESWLHRKNKQKFHVTSFRPSIIFGPNDSFFNRFAKLIKIAPFILPLPCSYSIYAPVYVGDVVNVMLACLKNDKSIDAKIEVCGPKVYSLYSLVKYATRLLNKRVLIIPLNSWLSYLQAFVFEKLPGKIFTSDNWASAKEPSICKQNFPDYLPEPQTELETIVPTYIGQNTINKIRQRWQKKRGHN